MEHKRMIDASMRALDLTNPINELWEKFYATQGEPEWIPNEYSWIQTKLHSERFCRRIERVLEPAIVGANQTALSQGKKAVVSLVGIGLGVWAINKVKQREIFNKVVRDIIARRDLTGIDSFDMVYLCEPAQDGIQTVIDATGRSIALKYTHDNPVHVVGPGKILFTMYAWDGNSFPGNEYWASMLQASGDPAAACCSTIPQLQNPFINKCLNSFNSLVVVP
jgi:hypothetical protein